MTLSRRDFVRRVSVSTAFAALAQRAQAQGRGGAPAAPDLQAYASEIEGYGPLVEDPRRIFDLPKDFRYRVISRTGDPMSDGLRVPGAPDGMAAFPGPNGRVLLVRNHEMVQDRSFEGAFGLEYELLPKIDAGRLYDGGKGRPHLGGTTTVVYNPATGQIERQFLSLGGTLRNCAGGATPWNSWLTCEEAVDLAGDSNERDHGYVFEVPASPDSGLTHASPLKALGRFYHEAVAVEPTRGIVYQTEDRADGLLYRFVPATPRSLTTGRLQALAVRDRKTFDTRNYAETGAARMPVGEWLTVRWVDLEDVQNPKDDLRTRGASAGAALFARGEGMYYGNNEVYFACTTGGLALRGQIFRYVPSPAEGTPGEDAQPGRLQLFVEPNNAALLESVDNIAVAPWGDVIACEDGAAPAPTVVRQNPLNYLRGITRDGKMYTIGRNRYVGVSELSGCCFSPDGSTLFLNIQAPGITLAITGPWSRLRR